MTYEDDAVSTRPFKDVCKAFRDAGKAQITPEQIETAFTNVRDKKAKTAQSCQ